MSAPDTKRIMVCDSCLRAGCYHGEMFCDLARGAGTVIRTIAELRALGLEHHDNWSVRTLERVYGDPDPFPVSATPNDGGEAVQQSHPGKVLSAAASPPPIAGIAPDQFQQMVEEAMTDAWAEICEDSGHHPVDLVQLGRKRLTFKPNHWAELIAMRLLALFNGAGR